MRLVSSQPRIYSYHDLETKTEVLDEVLRCAKDYLALVPEYVAIDLRNAVAKAESKIRSL